MPRSRNPKKRSSSYFWAPKGFSGMTDENFLAMSTNHTVRSTKRQTKPKKRETNKVAIAKSSTRKEPNDVNTSVICLEDSDDDDFRLDQSQTNEIKQSVLNKVDMFFKTSGLISDDDEPDIGSENVQNAVDLNQPSCSTHKTNELTDKSFNSENVLNVENLQEIKSLAEIESYCKETEDLLRNANALLEKYTGTSKKTEPVEVEKEKQESEVSPKRLGECPVCYEDLSQKQVMSTKCGHLFCAVCLKRIAISTKKCPTCRKIVNNKNIIPIYI